MISTLRCAVVLAAFSVGGVWAAEKTVVKASDEVTPGQYSISVMPTFNTEMGDRLQKGMDAVPGVDDVSAHTDDSTLRFTVKEGSRVKVAQLQKAVGDISAGAVVSTPLLKNTMNTNPGL